MFPSLCLQSLSICDSCLSLPSTPEALVIEGEPKQDAWILNVKCKLQFSSSMNVLVDYIIQILGRTGPVIDWIPRKSCCWISAFLNSPVTSFHCSGSSSLCILVLFQCFDSTKQCVRFPWLLTKMSSKAFYIIDSSWLNLTFGWT